MSTMDPRASVTLASSLNSQQTTYTVNSGAGLTYADGNWNSVGAIHPSGSGKIQLTGNDADIEFNGESLLGMIKNIERRLNILKINPELESEWEELRLLGDQYRALEKQIKDKMKTWEILNK